VRIAAPIWICRLTGCNYVIGALACERGFGPCGGDLLVRNDRYINSEINAAGRGRGLVVMDGDLGAAGEALDHTPQETQLPWKLG